jgi:hypothetical protein
MAGSDSNTDDPTTPFSAPYGRSLLDELELMVDAGLTPIQAIQSATSISAKYFGMHDRGIIKKGYRADLLLIEMDMLFQKLETTTVEVMLDKFAVKELIELERFCRDNAIWDQMYQCYFEKSIVTVSWYKGDGRGFVNESSKMKNVAPHKLNNTLIWLNAGKAVAVCMACIQTRKEIDSVQTDLNSYVRLVYTAVKEESRWKIVSMDAIYEKDCLIPASPEDRKPNPNSRDSYANLVNVIGSEGYDMDQNLAGDDRPELREALLAKVENWLMGSNTKM